MGIINQIKSQQSNPSGGGIVSRIKAQQTGVSEPLNPWEKTAEKAKQAYGENSLAYKATLPAQFIQNAGVMASTVLGKSGLGIGELGMKSSAFANKIYGNKQGEQYFSDRAKELNTASKEIYTKPFERQSETAGGQTGTALMNLALMSSSANKANIATKGLPIVPKVLARTGADVAFMQGQSGGNLDVAKGTTLPSLAGNILFNGKGGMIQQGLKGTLSGYTGDVNAGLMGWRGEDRTGIKSAIPGLQTPIGGLLGVSSGYATSKTPEYLKIKEEKIYNKNLKTLETTKKYQSIQKEVSKAKRFGNEDPIKQISKTDLMNDSIDVTGNINTLKEGGAVSRFNEQIDPYEGAVGNKVRQENLSIDTNDLRTRMIKDIENSQLKGSARITALKKVDDEIAGMIMESKDGGKTIPLITVHETKAFKGKTPDYANPGNHEIDKEIIRSLKEIVQDASGFEVQKLNKELSNLYDIRDTLILLNNKKVDGGKLGRIASGAVGALVGSHFGPLGTIVGAELGSIVKGVQMSGKLRGASGNVPISPEMQALGGKAGVPITSYKGNTKNVPMRNKNLLQLPAPRNQIELPAEGVLSGQQNLRNQSNSLGSLNTTQSTTNTKVKTVIGSIIPQKGVTVKAEKHSFAQDPNTKKFFTAYKGTGQSGKIATKPLIGAGVGSLAGIEKDENGKYRYNATKGMAGALGGAIIGGTYGKGDQRGMIKNPFASSSLLTEAKKYKTADEFIKSQQPEKVNIVSATQKADYMGGHEAPMGDGGAPIWDLNGKYTNNAIYPEDFYTHGKYYEAGETYDSNAISIMQSLKNRPNASVTVYRAVSKDIKNPKINPGDWISTTKEYAKDHGESNLGGNYKIISQPVKARDIFTDGNSIHEFGYDPQPELRPKDMPYDLLKRTMDSPNTKTAIHKSDLSSLWEKAQTNK